MRKEVDIVVLGAGLSGCATAALLASQGFQVAIITRDEGTVYHLPESWVYNPSLVIQQLGLEEAISKTLKKQARCVFASSDHQHIMEVIVKDKTEGIKAGDVVWVDRNQLDKILLSAALEQGAVFYPSSHIADFRISPQEVLLSAKHQNEAYTFKASYVVDATGKTAFLSNCLNLLTTERKLDSRAAYFSHFESSSGVPQEMSITHIDGGYIFCIPLSKTRLSIGCVIAEHLVKADSSPEAVFNRVVSSSSYVSDIISASARVLPVIPAKNSQRICLEPAGLRYRLVGEAAAFLDPFFSPGIDFAFFSSHQAAVTLKNQDGESYKLSIKEWLEHSRFSVYEQIERSDWKDALRLFADPHLPSIIPLMLTQAFCQSQGSNLSFKDGIEVARRAYEMAPN